MYEPTTNPSGNTKMDETWRWWLCFMSSSYRPRQSTILYVLYYTSGTPEQWVLFWKNLDKVLIGQNITTSPPTYNAMTQHILEGASLAGSETLNTSKRYSMTWDPKYSQDELYRWRNAICIATCKNLTSWTCMSTWHRRKNSTMIYAIFLSSLLDIDWWRTNSWIFMSLVSLGHGKMLSATWFWPPWAHKTRITQVLRAPQSYWGCLSRTYWCKAQSKSERLPQVQAVVS
jgi:hypothetical protein